ncbi:helix-turn-helix transcriptional regulator [Sphingomonas sp. ID1715]|uniref:helix-turn-helix transcriptional regulator n=1 Tax=Sphingomonas sp. ID1715 TaxID=1656898 RepID=UPI0034A09214
MDVLTVSEPREYLEQLIRDRQEDYASLSRLLGRNPSYIQQFIKRGSPKRLDGEDRKTLARYFGVPEVLLGGRDEALPGQLKKIPRLNVQASAGAGAITNQELQSDAMAFSDRMLRTLAGGNSSGLSMITVVGDSMEPTLSDGDDILVNRLDGSARLRDGIYVLRMGDGLHVKRIASGPDRSRVTIVSDNDAYPAWPDVELKNVLIIGRVVWGGKRFR